MSEKNPFETPRRNDELIKHIARFVANLWQIHPFGEGNTRTTSVFAIKYLRSLGFQADNTTFRDNSWYFRNALVRANYTNINKGIYMNTEYLEKFFRNLLLGEHNELKNRYCHIRYNENVGVEQDGVGVNVGVKTQSNEEKLLDLIKSDSSISAKKAAELLQLSQRQAERLFATLKQKGLIKRTGADKNGKWEIV